MLSFKKSLEETILKMRNLLSEAGEKPNMQTARRVVGRVDPSSAAQTAKASANAYGDRLGATDKLRANEIVKSTLSKGYAGAIDATFINDLDARWVNNKRVSLDTPKLISYDYIIQMLGYLYNTTEGETVEVGGQNFTMTSSMKKNIEAGLMKMFDLQDKQGRWRWFIFGSNFPGVSMVPANYRPKISTKPNGMLDFDEVDQYMSYLNFWLKGGQLLNMMTKAGFYDKGFAYALTTLRMKYIELQRDKGRGKKRNSDADMTMPDAEWQDKVKHDLMNDPSMVGGKSHLGGKIDQTMDLRYLGTKDRGEDPGHNSLTRFVNALKVDIDGSSDLDGDSSEVAAMAKFVAEGLLKFVTEYYAQDPKFIDLFKAKMSRVPPSLNDITAPEFAAIYPHANAWFQGKPRNYPHVYFGNAYKKAIKPEADNLEAQFIKDMEMNTKPVGARDAWQEKEKNNDAKLSYNDYVHDDPNDVWQSLEETDGVGDGQKLKAAMSMALDKFFLSEN
jgi:hypothetical protein